MKTPRPVSQDGVAEERRYQLLTQALTDTALYLLDRKGVVTMWNPGAERITSFAAADIVGHHIAAFHTPEDRRHGLVDEALARAAQSGRFETEGWRLRKDGSTFWALCVLEAMRDAGGELIGYAAVMRDMTERRAAQDALPEPERRFRMLVQAVTGYAIYMIDPSGIVVNWNAGAQRIKGYAANEIVGRHFSLFYAREDRAQGLPARALHIAAQEGRHESEGWRLRKDGTRFWASAAIDAIRDERGQLIGFAEVTRDVTHQRAAQEALRESERQFRLLVAGVTDYAIFMMDPNGIVSNWNAGAQRIKGYRAEEIVGSHFSRFYTEPERSAGRPGRALQIAAAEGKYETEGWRVRKDGSLFWASVVIDAVRDEEGRLIGFAKVTRDITERREAQMALERANQQLAQAQKMEALGQLTGGVAHDFNNLLMIVSGHAQMLRNRASDPRDRKALEAIMQAASRGESLTRQLLAFSRRQPLRPETVRLQSWIGGFRDMLASSAGPPELALSLPPDTWPVRVDIAELELALVNIVVNARDAMPEGGIVTLTAENVHLDGGDPQVPLAGDYVALSVADCGCGIPPDILPKVFDPFFTTKQVGKGTGLGLSQVHGFAHQSGGTVTVASELGMGTRFTLYLPKAAAEPARRPQGEVPEGVGGTVLLIEDNPEVAQVSAGLLAQLGCEVVTTVNAEHALEVLAAGAQADLVFTDIVMPGMDGLALARKLEELYPELPVLLTTGYANAAEAAATGLPILRKPYDIADLGRAVANVLAERHASGANLVHFPHGKPRKG